jgi:hypothetical protein
MRYPMMFCILLLAVSAKAQLAVIDDPDGFVNVREVGAIKSEIIGKLNSGDVVLYDSENENQTWKNIFYSPDQQIIYSYAENSKIISNKNYVTGFVHTSRIFPIEKLPQMNFKKGIGYIGNDDTIRLFIKTRPFNIKSHKILMTGDGCINCNKKFVDKIDGRKPWGVDGNLPAKEIYNILLTINGKAVMMPIESYNDIYEPGLMLSVHYDKYGRIYLYMPNNSDGAGGYDIVWVVYQGQLIKRYVDSID